MERLEGVGGLGGLMAEGCGRILEQVWRVFLDMWYIRWERVIIFGSSSILGVGIFL